MKKVQSSERRRNTYQPEIDGLRALAVLAVIINHISSNVMPSGYLGVDIFFVISGYVITGSLAKSPSDSILAALRLFYLRRIKRLFPALVFCVLVTGIAASLVNPQPGTSIFTGIYALFGLSNLYLLYNSTSYFGESATFNFFTHTWTLGLEEQFYLIFPMIYLGMTRTVYPLSGQKNFLILLAILILTSLCFFSRLAFSHPDVAFFMMPFRFWELGAGSMLFLILKNSVLNYSFVAKLNSGVILTFLVTALFIPKTYFVTSAIVVVCLSILLIISFSGNGLGTRLLRHRFIVSIGLMSYSIYLWHWSVIVLSRWTVGIDLWTLPFQITLTFLLAWLSYRFIEKPLRYKQWGKTPNSVFLLAPLISLVVTLVLLSLLNENNSRIYLGKNTLSNNTDGSSELLMLGEKDSGLQIAIDKALFKRTKCNLTPHHLRGKDYRPQPIIDEAFFDQCLDSHRQKIVLIGDSFANTIFKHVASAAHSNGLDFSMLFGYGCPYPLSITNIKFAAKNNCEVNSEYVLDSLIKRLNPGDVVIFRLFFQKSQYINLPKNIPDSILTAYDSELTSLIDAVTSRKSNLIVVGTNGEKVTCKARGWGNSCPKEIDMQLTAGNRFAIEINKHLSELAKTYPDEVKFIDPLIEICSKDLRWCPIETASKSYMSDDTHLSEFAVDKLNSKLLESIKSFEKLTEKTPY